MIRPPVIEEINNPPSPIKLFNNLKHYPYAFFLDSGCSYEKLGRFSFLGCEPFLVFKSKGNSVSLEWSDGRKKSYRSDPFLALKDIFKRYEIINGHPELPFTSGAVGYFGYDLKDYVEELPDKAADDLGLPDCVLAFYDSVIIYDNLKNKAYVSSLKLTQAHSIKNRISASPIEEKTGSYRVAELKSNFTKPSYLKAIEKAKAYIKKGDIYQVNLSQRFEAELNMDPMELYTRLKDYSPAPFSSYLDFKDAAILSSSPERYLLKRARHIETRPIKGTRPRGKDILSDLLLERELVNSEKDRAEHIMIVDLERNDLGRICEYGSVRPTETFVLEKYSNVFHLVSTVAGRLKDDVGPIDCLLATFPGGSITGAPKIRAMEIIEELEPVKRSVYTGAIGYISFDGNMDTSIVIRTFIIKDKRVYFQVGGGIVADSVPEKEYEETIDKAQGLMKALGIGLPDETKAVKEYIVL